MKASFTFDENCFFRPLRKINIGFSDGNHLHEFMNKLDPRNIYDDLHQIPELGFEEFKTSAYLADKLEAMGYKVTRNIGGTGVITIGQILAMAAHIEGKGCTVLDMSGLAQKGGPGVAFQKE